MARRLRILGISGEICSLDVEAGQTLQDLLEALEVETGIPPREQRLFLDKEELRDRKGRLDFPGDSELTLVRRDPEQARWLEVVETDYAGNALSAAPAHVREDREVILKAMRKRPQAFRFASPKLQADRAFMLEAVRENKNALQYASRELLADREVVLQACTHHGCAIQFASRELRADPEIATAAATSDAESLKFLGHELWSNRDFILSAVKVSGQALKVAAANLQKDRDVCLAAVAKEGQALQFAAPELLQDRDFVLQAARVSKFALKHASERLRADFDVVRAAVEADGGALCFAALHLRGDRGLALLAIKTEPEAVAFAARELWTADFFLAAVEANKGALWLCPPQLKGRRDWLLAAARSSEEVLKFAARDLQEDWDFVLQVLECGFEEALQHASPKLLASQNFILAATRKSDSALRHAAPELRADSAFVKTVVQRCGCALQHAARGPRADAPVALAAMRADPAAAQFVAKGLWLDIAFLKRAIKECRVPGDTVAQLKKAACEEEEEEPAAVRREEAKPKAAPTMTCLLPDAAEAPSPGQLLGQKASAAVRPVIQSSLLRAALERKELQPEVPRAEELRRQLPSEGPLESIDHVKLGDYLQVLEPASEVLRLCREANLDFADGDKVQASAGKYAKVLAVDPMDGSVECRVPGVGDVWLACAALRWTVSEEPISSMADIKIGQALQVLHNTLAVLEACNAADLGSIEDELDWEAAAGRVVEVIGRDAKDRTVECHVPDVGDVWFALSALTLVQEPACESAGTG